MGYEGWCAYIAPTSRGYVLLWSERGIHTKMSLKWPGPASSSAYAEYLRSEAAREVAQ